MDAARAEEMIERAGRVLIDAAPGPAKVILSALKLAATPTIAATSISL